MLINLEARVDNGSDPGAVREKVAGSLEQKVVRGRAGRDAKVTGMTERVQESRTRLGRGLGFSILLALSSDPQRPAGGGPAAAGRAQLTPALCPQAERKQKAAHFSFIQSVPSVLSSEACV